MNGPLRPRLPDARERERLVRELETSFAVGAGAGSGKTRVLVDRVVALIDRGVPLEQVVAITFTEKAASELRERVRQALIRPDDRLPPEVRARRAEAHRSMELAQLTTIHGFCRSILASRPVEAGVSPGFRVLDALQARLLLEEVAARRLEELRRGEPEGLEGALRAGLRLEDLPGLVEAVLRYPELVPRAAPPAGTEEGPETVLAGAAELAAATLAAAAGVDPEDRGRPERRPRRRCWSPSRSDPMWETRRTGPRPRSR
jgi:hypothetical protein